MGPMLVLVLAIVSCVGFSIYHLGETHRFDIIGDAKGGVYVLDRKTSSINYCTEESCRLIGNGSLPSHAAGNPAVLAGMQHAIMGAPAIVGAKQAGQVPAGMNANIAASGAAPLAATDAAAAESEMELEEESEAEASAPEGFEFN